MKNLTKRNKIILGIVGIVVVVAVAVGVFFQAGGEDLFGSIYNISISPSTAEIAILGTQSAHANTGLVQCNWYSENPLIASISSSAGKDATVKGLSAGSVVIHANCGARGNYKGTMTVKVDSSSQPYITAITPPAPQANSLSLGTSYGLQTSATAHWDAKCSGDLQPNLYVPNGYNNTATFRATSPTNATGQKCVVIFWTDQPYTVNSKVFNMLVP